MVWLHFARGILITAFSCDSVVRVRVLCWHGRAATAAWKLLVRHKSLMWPCDCVRHEYCLRFNEQIHFASILLINYRFFFVFRYFYGSEFISVHIGSSVAIYDDVIIKFFFAHYFDLIWIESVFLFLLFSSPFEISFQSFQPCRHVRDAVTQNSSSLSIQCVINFVYVRIGSNGPMGSYRLH